jgi:tRNA-dihydrouridine synthase A
LGRAAWHDPAVLVRLSKHLQHRPDDVDEAQLIDTLVQYADSQMSQGVPLRVLVRPLLGLWQGRTGARRWRRSLSDAASLHLSDATLIWRAWQSVGPASP